MPLPAIFGITALWASLSALITSLATALIHWLSIRMVFKLGVVAIIFSLTAGFFAAVHALIGSLSASMPAIVNTAASWVLPSNFPLCISALITALSLRFAYRFRNNLIQFFGR